MKFSYKARTKEGEFQIGNIEAETKDGALNALLGYGLFVLDLDEIKENLFRDRFFGFLQRVKTAEVMVFTRQFATLLESQVPLSDSLANLFHQTKNPILKTAIGDVLEKVQSGRLLSQALAGYDRIFSEFYINMIKSAEVTGRLSEVLSFLADHLENQAALVSKIKNALFYPAFTIVLFFVIVLVMAVFVLPQIAPIFQESNIKIPAFTRAIIVFGEIITKWWWALGVIIGLFVFIVGDYFRTAEGRAVRDEIVLRIPVAGQLLQKMYIARFAESARVLIKGGLTIPQAIDISSRTIGSAVYQELLQRAAAQVRKGRLLSQALAEMREFPPLVSQLTAIGEATGRLETLLSKVNLFYTREVNDTVDNLVELIQPVLMVLIGSVVALLFVSILMPIYNLSQSFTSGETGF